MSAINKIFTEFLLLVAQYEGPETNNARASAPRVRASCVLGVSAMAIQDYVKSLATSERISKAQVFRFLELQFARADKNHDGQLDLDELAAFVQAVSCPEIDRR
jgi:hypothetical protein